jgi:hypothetical protein
LVTWAERLSLAPPQYFASREDAQRNAPVDHNQFSIVNVYTRPKRPQASIGEILAGGRPMTAPPSNEKGKYST